MVSLFRVAVNICFVCGVGGRFLTKLLLIEDSRFFSNLIKNSIEKILDVDVYVAASLAEGKALIKAHKSAFFLALLDLNLPDACGDEVVEAIHEHDIPCVVFTGSFDEDLREQILEMGVIDYVTKDNPSSIDYVVSLVRRVQNNAKQKALVVDDSVVARTIAARLLKLFQFQVIEAKDGAEALEIIDQHSTRDGNEIGLVLTDYNMPGMNGFELVRTIRKTCPKSSMAIIGISSQSGSPISTKFIKNGANDFLTKPFFPEELLCRVSQNMDIIDQLSALRIAATRDYLTGMVNRRYFFEMANPIYASAKRNGSDVLVAMVDVDHFKNVNDTYGHDVGDDVLVGIAGVLDGSARDTDIIARFGGEEFCVIAPGIQAEDVKPYLDKIRTRIEALSFTSGETTFKLTASIGATCSYSEDLEHMISESDNMLYEAKETGRNKVVVFSAAQPEEKIA